MVTKSNLDSKQIVNKSILDSRITMNNSILGVQDRGKIFFGILNQPQYVPNYLSFPFLMQYHYIIQLNPCRFFQVQLQSFYVLILDYHLIFQLSDQLVEQFSLFPQNPSIFSYHYAQIWMVVCTLEWFLFNRVILYTLFCSTFQLKFLPE